jgi:CCAAT/enhancer binding protein (C/EBP) gamma
MDRSTRSSRSSESERYSDDYKIRRERNNIAVKKSREKTRERAKETLVRVAELKQENTALEGKVALLSKELTLLKDLLLAHASGRRNSNEENFDHEDTMAGSHGILADPASVKLDHLYSA